MKLADLRPKWGVDADIVLGGVIVHDESRTGMGITFQCPCCVGTPRATRLGVFFRNPVDGKPPSDDFDAQHLWLRTGTTFEDLSLSPSINASEYGHWHGFITNGEVT